MENQYKEKVLVRIQDMFPDKEPSYYKNIKSIKFLPKKRVEVMKVDIKKGEVFFWKLFGFIPLIPFKAKVDLYKFPTKLHNSLLRFGTKEEYFQLKWSFNSCYTLEGDEVYMKPYVEIEFETPTNNSKYDTMFFGTNERASEYFDHLEKKCKKYCNYLVDSTYV